MKLNKRVSAIEFNISLTSEYLSELSRRYVAQIEEIKQENENNMKLVQEMIRRETTNLKRQFYEQIHDLREELMFLAKAIKSRPLTSSVLPTWRKDGSQQFINSLTVRENSNYCEEDGVEYDDVYLDKSDGLWTVSFS